MIKPEFVDCLAAKSAVSPDKKDEQILQHLVAWKVDLFAFDSVGPKVLNTVPVLPLDEKKTAISVAKLDT